MRTLAWLLVLSLLACGSRTPLRLASGSSDDGDIGASGSGASAGFGPASGGPGGAGAAGSGGSGAGAAGGSGGAEIACAALEQNGDFVMVPTSFAGGGDSPALHSLGDGRLALVHRWLPQEGPVAADAVTSVTFDWIESWPPAFEAPVELVATGQSFAVDRGESSLIGLLTRTDSQGTGVSFGFADAEDGGWGPLVATAGDATRAVFVAATSSGRHFVGMQRPGGFLETPSYELLVGWVHQPPNGVQYDGPHARGCVDREVAADGLETPSGWLLARAMPNDGVCFDDTPPAPATTLTVTRWASDGGEYFGLDVPQPSPVVALAMVRTSSGAWLPYLRDQTLEAVRMDDEGLLQAGPVALTAAEGSALSFGAARLGEGMAIAFVDQPNSAGANLVVEATDAAGLVTATATIESSPITPGAPAVTFDPNTKQLLVAFTG